MQDQASIRRFLVLGALETLLNQALEMEGAALERLKSLAGTVIRVRTERPAMTFYLLISEDGIDVLDQYEGRVDIRVRGPLGALLFFVVAPHPDPEDTSIRIQGISRDQVEELRELMVTFNIWAALKEWVDGHVQLEGLMGLLRRQDPGWLARLQDLPGQVALIIDRLDSQANLQSLMLNELRDLKRSLRRERRLDLLCMVLGMGFLLAALASATGNLPLLTHSAGYHGLQVLLLAATGLTLLLSRVLLGHRYD